MKQLRTQLGLALLGYAAQRDLDPAALCAQADISYEALANNRGSISEWQMENLWYHAVQRTGDSLFGLHFGEQSQLAALGVVGEVVRTSQTVGEALAAAGGMVELICDRVQLQVEADEAFIRVTQIISEPPGKISQLAVRQLQDFLQAFVVHELDGLILQKVVPSQVILTSFTNQQAAEYQRVLRCQPVTGRIHQLRFPLNLWQVPLIPAQIDKQQYLLQLLSTSLQQIQNATGMAMKVNRFLLQQTYLGLPSVEDVAANFQITPRTLQRYLKKEGTSFSLLQAAARKKLALEMLKSGKHTVGEVAYKLGYLEPSAFIRAFRRWTGDSPTNYIQKQRMVVENDGQTLPTG